MGVAEDGVPLVNLLHHVRVQAVLLEKKGAIQESWQTHHKKHTCTCSLLHRALFQKSKIAASPGMGVGILHSSFPARADPQSASEDKSQVHVILFFFFS